MLMIIWSLAPISYILYCHVCTYREMAMRQVSLGRISGFRGARKTVEITCRMQYAVLSADGEEAAVGMMGSSDGSLNGDDVQSDGDDEESKQWRSLRLDKGPLETSGSDAEIRLTGVAQNMIETQSKKA